VAFLLSVFHRVGHEPQRVWERVFPRRRGDRQLCCRQRGRAPMESGRMRSTSSRAKPGVLLGELCLVVYVIESISTGRLYIGQTDDLVRCLAEHNSLNHKPTKYTSRHAGPWRLIYHEVYPSRSEAMHREHWLKSCAGREWLNRRFDPPQAK